jgi:hypothetical protein
MEERDSFSGLCLAGWLHFRQLAGGEAIGICFLSKILAEINLSCSGHDAIKDLCHVQSLELNLATCDRRIRLAGGGLRQSMRSDVVVGDG